jgi:hypothetical protein
MSTNRPSYFLLIQLRHQRLNLTLPIPLFVLEDVLAGINDLGLLWSRFFPRQKLPALFTTHCLELFQELRRFGSWQFLEAADGKSRISLKFY